MEQAFGLPVRNPFGPPIIHLPSVDSTNNYAANLVRAGEVAHGTVILADTQTAGRGQRGRTWFTGSGSDLACTVVFRPTAMGIEKQFGLSMLVALTLRELLESLGIAQVKVKWPNDILVVNKKIAGLLLENTIAGQRLDAVLVGVGLNVGPCNLPGGIQATSLQRELILPMTRNALLSRLLESLHTNYSRWVGGGMPFPNQPEELWGVGEWQAMSLDDELQELQITGVEPGGKLRVSHRNGVVNSYGTDRLRLVVPVVP